MPQNFICIVLPCAALLKLHGDLGGRVGPKFGDLMATGHQTWQWKSPINGGLNGIIYIYILYIYMGITCFTSPTQCFQVFYMCTFQRCCARVRDVVHVSQQLCKFHRSCALFKEAVHVSQAPNNVRVQLHWGDQTRSPDICINIIYVYITGEC